MANSRIGQYQLEYVIEGYTAPVRSHLLRLWIPVQGNPPAGTPATSIDVAKLGGSTAKLDVVANQAWSYFRLGYATTVSCINYSLWKYATENARDFVASGAITTPAGAAGSVVVAGQVTLTFRHALGAIGKIVMIESSQGGDNSSALVPNAAGSPIQRIAAYLMSADSPMTALDNSFPVAPLRDSRGQNERAWREVFR